MIQASHLYESTTLVLPFLLNSHTFFYARRRGNQEPEHSYSARYQVVLLIDIHPQIAVISFDRLLVLRFQKTKASFNLE